MLDSRQHRSLSPRRPSSSRCAVIKAYEPGNSLNVQNSLSARSLPSSTVVRRVSQANPVSVPVGEPNGISEPTRAVVAAMVKQQMDGLREEFRCMCTNLEKRLTRQIEITKSRIDAQLQALDLRMAEIVLILDKRFPPHNSQEFNANELSCYGLLVHETSKQVIERVSANPRINEVVENHHFLLESFSKLLQRLDKGSLDIDWNRHTDKTEKDTLCEMILLVNEQRTREVSNLSTHIQTLEEKLNDIESTIIRSNGVLGKLSEGQDEARGLQGLQPVEEEENEDSEMALQFDLCRLGNVSAFMHQETSNN